VTCSRPVCGRQLQAAASADNDTGGVRPLKKFAPSDDMLGGVLAA
jgi:hypothetical protein